MCGHQGAEGADNGIEVANSKEDKDIDQSRLLLLTVKSPVVFGEGEQEIGGELIEAELLAGAGEAVHLEGILDGGVQEELRESGVRLHGSLQLFLQ